MPFCSMTFMCVGLSRSAICAGVSFLGDDVANSSREGGVAARLTTSLSFFTLSSTGVLLTFPSVSIYILPLKTKKR